MMLLKLWRQNLLFLFAVVVLGMSLTRVIAAEVEVSVQENKQALKLGFFPIVSTVALFKRFSPLRDYLAEALGRPVELQTAKDFLTFMQRTDEGSYDIVITAPHFAVRAVDSGKYIIRATVTENVQQLFIVPEDSPVKSLQELAGKNIATPPETALMTMMGIRYLADAGLKDDKQPHYRAFTSHNAANQALLAKEVDAAIASSNIVRKAIKQGEKIRILENGNSLPNMPLMVASGLDADLGERISAILVNMSESEKGREVLKQIAFPGYRTVTAKDYEPARIYMEQAVADIK